MKINYICKICKKEGHKIKWSISKEDFETNNPEKMKCKKCGTPVDSSKFPKKFIIAWLK